MLRLRTDQMDAFYDTGFMVQPDVFAAAEVARMRDAFDRLESTARRLGSTTMHDGSQFVLDTILSEVRTNLKCVNPFGHIRKVCWHLPCR